MNTARTGSRWPRTSTPVFERVDLPPVRVALDHDVEQPEGRLGRRHDFAREQDRAGARPEQRAAAGVIPSEAVEPRLVPHQVEQRGALSAGKDETGEVAQLGHAPDGHRLGAGPRQRAPMGVEIALQRQNADPRHRSHHPRVCNSSDGASPDVSIPAIASPRSRDTSTRIAGSR
jgi:hypothetical protein